MGQCLKLRKPLWACPDAIALIKRLEHGGAIVVCHLRFDLTNKRNLARKPLRQYVGQTLRPR
ncbi:MAG: hypothetical protein AAGE59_07870 [Cyanobacteria bacterium P01_F01_bin.86]